MKESRREPVRILILLSTLILVTGALTAAEPDAAAIDEIFADVDRTDGPGCALGVVRDGELVYQRGYGLANLEHGLALTSESVFRIASTSKQFTAMAVLLLAREGKLDLDADIRTYLPALRAYEQPVTTRHLLHHVSGYRDYLTLMSLAGLRDDDWVTDAQVMDLLARQKELNFAPGTEYLYSNSGYFLLSQIVRAASGKSLREYAQQKIFAPLGMRSTHFHDDHKHIVPGRATGYAPLEGGGYRISTTTLDMVGDGGVFTSVEDLAVWDHNFYDNRLGDDSLLEEYLTPATLESGERIHYAFGLTLREYRGLQRQAHGGSFVGYRTFMIRFPEERLSVICLCNRSDAQPARRAMRVVDLLLADRLAPETAAAAGDEDEGEPEAVEVAPELLEPYVGGYLQRDADAIVRIELEDGQLFLADAHQRNRLLPSNPTEFRLADVPYRLTASFEPGGAKGARGALRVEVEGRDEPRLYDPVELVAPGPADLEAYAGLYGCEELDAVVRVWTENGRLRVAHADPFKESPEEPLRPTTTDRFERKALVLHFARDDRGRPVSFRVGAGRVRNLLCERTGGS